MFFWRGKLVEVVGGGLCVSLCVCVCTYIYIIAMYTQRIEQPYISVSCHYLRVNDIRT